MTQYSRVCAITIVLFAATPHSTFGELVKSLFADPATQHAADPDGAALLAELSESQQKLVREYAKYYARLPDGRIVNSMILWAGDAGRGEDKHLDAIAVQASKYIRRNGRTACVFEVGPLGAPRVLWYSGIDGTLEYPGVEREVLDNRRDLTPQIKKIMQQTDVRPRVYEVVRIIDDSALLVQRRIDLIKVTYRGYQRVSERTVTEYGEHCVLLGVDTKKPAIATGDRLLLRHTQEEVSHPVQSDTAIVPQGSYRTEQRTLFLPDSQPVQQVRIDQDEQSVRRFRAVRVDDPTLQLSPEQLALAIWRRETRLGVWRSTGDEFVFQDRPLKFKTAQNKPSNTK